MEKKKYEVKIADVEMAIISDEREEFVQRLVSELDSRISEITLQSKRCSKLDASILVALDYASNHAKAEKRVRNLEAQIALYDANLRRMRDENIKLKNALLEGREVPVEELKLPDETTQLQFDVADEPAEPEKAAENEDSDVKVPTEGGTDSRDDKIRKIADLFHKSAPEESDDPKKDDKLRQIESLLRSKGE